MKVIKETVIKTNEWQSMFQFAQSIIESEKFRQRGRALCKNSMNYYTSY